MKEQLANMTIIELVRTGHSFATSIQHSETHSAIVREMASRLEALNIAYIRAMNIIRSATDDRAQQQPGITFFSADELSAALGRVQGLHEISVELIAEDVFKQHAVSPATDAWQREQLRAGVEPQKPILSQAITDIIAERQRQKEKKGYTESRDDNYLPGVLNLAGAAYAVSVSYIPDAKRRADRLWPWPDAGKYLNASSKDPRSALIKAAALITAEIERIDRAQLRNGEAV